MEAGCKLNRQVALCERPVYEILEPDLDEGILSAQRVSAREGVFDERLAAQNGGTIAEKSSWTQ